MYFVGHTLCDSSDHKAQLQFGGEFSIPHGAPWTLPVFTGALKSGDVSAGISSIGVVLENSASASRKK